MSDVSPTPDQLSDDPVAEAPAEEAAPAENPLAAYDAVMGPYLGRLGGVGLVSEHHLLGFARTLRGALMALVTGAELPEPGPAHDAYGDQVRAQKAARDEAALPPEPETPAEPPTNIENSAEDGAGSEAGSAETGQTEAGPTQPETPTEIVEPPPPPPPPEDQVLTSGDVAADVEPPIA